MNNVFEVVQSVEWLGGRNNEISFKVEKVAKEIKLFVSNGDVWDFRFAENGKAYFQNKESYEAGKNPCTTVSENVQSLLIAYTNSFKKKAKLVEVKTDRPLDAKNRKKMQIGKVFTINGKDYAYYYGE